MTLEQSGSFLSGAGGFSVWVFLVELAGGTSPTASPPNRKNQGDGSLVLASILVNATKGRQKDGRANKSGHSKKMGGVKN